MLIGLFEDTNQAKSTIDDLKKIGTSGKDISLLSPEPRGDVGDLHLEPIEIPGLGRVGACGPMTNFITKGTATEAPSTLVAALTRLGLTREQSERYVEGIRRGYTLEAVTVEDAKASEAFEIMREHSIEKTLKKETATAPAAAATTEPAAGATTEAATVPAAAATTEATVPAATATTEATAPAAAATTEATVPAAAATTEATTRAATSAGVEGAHAGETVIPVIAEELAVGKRVEEVGGVAVRTHVTETPVEEQVELREEHVTVERRPVHRAISPQEAAEAFHERSVEVVAEAEEPVVQKRPYVREEVVVGKEVGTRTETVRDTVRTTEVEVENLDRAHFARASTKGEDFESYRPAYEFGRGLRGDTRYAGQDWSEIEPKARESWEGSRPGTWERVKDAIRDAWERAKTG